MADEMEQQLRTKIAAQKASIVELPTLRSIVDETGLTSPETKARAQLIEYLSDDEEKLELLLESKRVSAVVRLQDELHPPQNSEDCPICLETIKHVNRMTIKRLFCCGGWICKQCGFERIKDEEEGLADKFRGKCPLCRESIPDANDHKKIITLTSNHANKGRAWAQANVGTWYLRGLHGFALDKQKGLQFIKQAADQRWPDALFEMAMEYRVETLERDESKYMYYLKEAANLGHPDAQRMLGAYDRQKDDNIMLLHYITLAASQGNSTACGILGHYFSSAEWCPCGLTKSLILAKHYSKMSLEEDEDGHPLPAFNLSLALYRLGLQRYEEIMEIPGHSPIPKALFWARKGLEDETFPLRDNLTFILSAMENEVKNHCANCRKKTECSSLKRCIRCLGAWYCGKDCQVQHWKAGHKIDCIKRK